LRQLTFYYYDVPTVLCVLAVIIYGIRFKQLEGHVIWILAILIANAFTDVTSYVLIHMERETHVLYNLLIPVERSVILFIYAANEYEQERKRIYYFGAAAVWFSFAVSTLTLGSLSELHYVSNIVTGLVLAALSYVHLRSVSLNTAGQSVVMLYFGLANMIYFTLMISAMSALPLAQQIDLGFAVGILSLNTVAYGIRIILLIIGILWKRPKI